MKNKHGGNIREISASAGRAAEEIIDFSANINPLGPPEWFRSRISSSLSSIAHYPDPDSSLLINAISLCYNLNKEEVVVGNGSTELLYAIPRILNVKRAVIPVPSYSDYITASELAGLKINTIPLKEEDGFKIDLSLLESSLFGDEVVFIGNPNNPTGLTFDSDEFRTLALRHSSTLFVIDEAFSDFVDGIDRLIYRRPSNVIVISSLTKIFAIPGIRLGYAVLDRYYAESLKTLIPPWSVNSLAQAVGEEAVCDKKYIEKSKEFIKYQKEKLLKELSLIPELTVFPGQANFLLVRINHNEKNAHHLYEELLKEGVAIRICDNFNGLDERFFRIAVKTEKENILLCNLIKKVFNKKVSHSVKRKKPSIMICGTSSNAGKSVIAAALCRILFKDGFKVAPFKSQNMALNSFVTKDGGEMGRAQVVQAQASRVDPDVRMNPVLLKPTTDTGAQVIVMGEPVGNMNVEEYISFKQKAFQEAKRAFYSLSKEYDVIVLEGAGSPVEINLKSHDISNLLMAAYADAPVVIVGDIDRGGLFASFVGTMELLSEWERALVKGFIINRFRGKKELLRDAVTFTENHTRCPVLGVVPYIKDLALPEEDSVTFKNSFLENSFNKNEYVEIGIIDLPHISNFTDFDPLKIEPDVKLKVIRTVHDLDHPDALVLPGSKSVVSDLEFMHNSGIASKILSLAEKGETEIVGICGGFQMLGREISDPFKVESLQNKVAALGVLPINTVFAEEKIKSCVKARHLESGFYLKGYEIHHGRTEGESLFPLFLREDGEVIGMSSGGSIWGTYLHGLFDSDEFRRWFVDRLRIKKGLSPIGEVCAVYDLESVFERLASIVRESVQIEKIYNLMGLK